MADTKDYYEILGVTKSANPENIKRAYRKLALQYHPDHNKSKDAESKFKEITRAYEVLSDPQKKQTYDQFGHSAFERGGGQSPFGSTGGPFSYTYTSSDGAGFDFGGFTDPFEIFEQFFGGSPFGARSKRPTYSLTIDFMEAVHGTTKRVNIDGKQQTIKIPPGVDEGSRIRFGNYDLVLQVDPDRRFQREGSDIIGTLEISFAKVALGGEVYIETVDGDLKLKIPAGTQPGTTIRLRGKGVPYLHGQVRGDHYVRVKVTVPKHLSRRQREILREFEEEGKRKKGWF